MLGFSLNAEAIHGLLANLTAAIPHVVGPDKSLKDTAQLALLLCEWVPDEGIKHSELSAQFAHYLHAKNIKLAPALKAQLLFWQTLLSALEEKSILADELQVQQRRVRVALLVLALREPNVLHEATHPLLQFLTILLQQGCYWYPQSGKEGDAFYDGLVEAVDALILASRSEQLEGTPDVDRATEAVKNLNTLVAKQQARAQMMAQRCRDSELGLAKIHRAQMQVIELLEVLYGCFLPESLLQFVRTTLKGELQFILINQGESATAWQSWMAIINRLPQIFPPAPAAGDQSIEPEPPNRQQLYRDVQIIVGLLDEHVTVSAASQQAYDEGVADMREHLFEKLRAISVPLVIFEPLTVPDELSRVGARVSPSLLKKVASLQVGDWFLFSNNDEQLIRCRLLLRPPEIDQLLFVNRSGHRVLLKSVQDFSACLATHIAQPLESSGQLDQALLMTQKKLQLVIEQQHNLQKKADQAAANEQAVKAAAKKEVQRQKNQVEKDALAAIHTEKMAADSSRYPILNRKSAAQKAHQEARVLAKLEVRRERKVITAQVLAAGVEYESVASPTESVAYESKAISVDAGQLVKSLHIGAWLELPQAGSNSAQRCKLVAIMRSNNTYIFTNRQGIKVAEYDQVSLADLLADAKARVVSNGDDFEGQLSKVVLTLRRDT